METREVKRILKPGKVIFCNQVRDNYAVQLTSIQHVILLTEHYRRIVDERAHEHKASFCGLLSSIIVASVLLSVNSISCETSGLNFMT